MARSYKSASPANDGTGVAGRLEEDLPGGCTNTSPECDPVVSPETPPPQAARSSRAASTPASNATARRASTGTNLQLDHPSWDDSSPAGLWTQDGTDLREQPPRLSRETLRRGGDSRTCFASCRPRLAVRLGSDRSLLLTVQRDCLADARALAGSNPPRPCCEPLCWLLRETLRRGGIRTPGALASTTVFETAAFNRSATSPGVRLTRTFPEPLPAHGGILADCAVHGST